jgi:chitodextrinase
MPIRIDPAPVRDSETGELDPALIGQQVQIVTRGTTTPFPIQDGATDPITDSLVTVSTAFTTPTVYVADGVEIADLYLDWYQASSGKRGPVAFEAVLRDEAKAARTESAASAAAAQQALVDLQAYIAANPGGGGGVSAHGALSGLTTGDDHTQYLNNVRGDARYYPRATVDAIASSATNVATAYARQRVNHTGTQGIETIVGLQEALDNAGGEAGPDVPRVVIVASGSEARPEGPASVIWLDARADQSTPPTNMGENDIWAAGSFTAGADLVPPSVPTGLTTGSITASGVTLSWAASTDNVGVTAYEVRRDGSVSLGVAAGTSRVITGLSPSTAYTLQVRARDAAGNWSAWSTAASFSTSASSDTTAPTPPTGLASSGISSSGFTVTWGAGTDNVGVTGYDVRLNGGSPTTVAADPRSRAFTGLTASTAYTVEVRSRDAAGNTSTWASLGVTTLSTAADTYNVFGTSAPPGTYTWGTDGTPYIVVGMGFRCTEAGARAVGGRTWIPTAASGSLPTEATFYLFGPNQGLDSTPVQTKVVSTAGATAGSWVEALFDTPQAMGPTEVWMIGVRFTGTGDAGKYPFGSGVRASGSAVPSVGPLGEDLGWIEYGTALSSAHRIGTGSVVAGASNDHARALDIIVDLQG